MAGYGFKDISNIKGPEEDVLKYIVAEGWEMLKKVNWDDRDYCVYNPKKRVQYPVAKSFQTFFENEGWRVDILEKPCNMKFTIYKPTK